MIKIAEEFIIKIVDDARRAVRNMSGGAGGAGEAAIAGEVAAGKGAGLGSIAKLVGVASLGIGMLKLISDAVNSILKPVHTIISGIFKLLAQLLRPVVDLLIVLLQPILLLLKPIIKVFNETMRPFRQAAMQVLKESVGPTGAPSIMGIAESTQLIFQGFTESIFAVLKEVLIQSTVLILDMLNDFILTPILDALSPILETMGVDVDLLKKSIKENINSIVMETDDHINGTDGAMNLITGVFKKGIFGFGEAMVKEISNVWKEINAAVAKGNGKGKITASVYTDYSYGLEYGTSDIKFQG